MDRHITGKNILFSVARLTTIARPLEKMASPACRRLLDRISGKEQAVPKEILFEPELIVRGTA